MIHPFVLAVALLAASTPALACQCEDPVMQSDADRQQQAQWIVNAGGSIAEVELVRTSLGDRYRTVRHLFGERQISYGVRDPAGPVTSCDYGIAPGQRATMVFLPQRPAADGGRAPCADPPSKARKGYFPAGMCTQFFIQAAGNLERVRSSTAQ